jgi:DNA-binding transcriptional MocR family regulator
MSSYKHLSDTEIKQAHLELEQQFKNFSAQNLNLDMTRGKPSPQQLDLANELLSLTSYSDSAGTDCRNYGGLDGLPAMKSLFSEIIQTPVENIIVGGSSSLTLMFDTLVRACLFGVSPSASPWAGQDFKFLCPSPGYDRHFTVSQTLGLESIQVGMNHDGPDMDQIEALVAEDASIKGIWCVPKYSNPTGISYSDEVVDRLAGMKTAANDFRIMWDNAYAEHHFMGELDSVREIISACNAAGNPDRAYVFASTSKMSFAGSGVAAFASSQNNVKYAKTMISAQSIGPDKINQLRHLALFPDLASLRVHMNKHAALLQPKFARVEQILSDELSNFDVAHWTRPRGGYFTSLDLLGASAKRTIELSAELGVKLTAAGAPFPYGIDPDDANIRIAPSFPNLDDIDTAMRVLCLCVKLASVEAVMTATSG